jgi:hypothetical protein
VTLKTTSIFQIIIPIYYSNTIRLTPLEQPGWHIPTAQLNRIDRVELKLNQESNNPTARHRSISLLFPRVKFKISDFLAGPLFFANVAFEALIKKSASYLLKIQNTLSPILPLEKRPQPVLTELSHKQRTDPTNETD